jgi:hypothetical protein
VGGHSPHPGALMNKKKEDDYKQTQREASFKPFIMKLVYSFFKTPQKAV